ncbi:MAG: hypothetical protein ACT4O6_02510 [Reyranella sp.]
MSLSSPFRHANDHKRVAFLRELLRGANASLAAACANLNRGTVYRWKLEDPEFANLWAEIAATSRRRRTLRRRVLGPEERRETSHSASHDPVAALTPKSLWDIALGPVSGERL